MDQAGADAAARVRIAFLTMIENGRIFVGQRACLAVARVSSRCPSDILDSIAKRAAIYFPGLSQVVES